MNNESFPPLPPSPSAMFPQFRESSSSSVSSGTVGASPQQNIVDQEFYKYINQVYESVIPRIKAYEIKQEELDRAIQRERILESSVNFLRYLVIVLGILLMATFVSLGAIVFIVMFPNVASEYFTKYITLSFLTFVGAAIFYMLPVYDLKSYSKRLDAIEKKLKLNGNE